MQIARTTTKYFVLSSLGALVVAVGVLVVAPYARAQVVTSEPPSIDKECTPNPVQIGQQITCIIDVVAAPQTFIFSGGPAGAGITDTLPAGLRVTGATGTGGESGIPITCEVDGNTVTCPAPGIFIATHQFFRVTIEATALQCGTFQNTAKAEGVVESTESIEEGFVPYSVQDTEEITVVGCGGGSGGGSGGGGRGGGDGGGAAPITQEGEQESESGEIDQSFEVS